MLRRALSWFGRAVPAGAGSYRVSCPVPGHGRGNGDRHPSLSVSTGDKQPVVFACHAGCDQQAVLAALAAKGFVLADIMAPRPDRDTSAADSWLPCGHTKIAEYPYRHQYGRLAYAHTRCASKCFAWWRPDPTSRTGRRWSLSDKTGVRVVPYLLYRLPELVQAVAVGRCVWLTEGEKDADALAGHGVPACTSGGAKTWHDPDHAQLLAGADVVVCPDRDIEGQRYAEAAIRSLMPVARSILVVRAAVGKDAADHLAAGLGIGAFVDMGEPKPAPVLITAGWPA